MNEEITEEIYEDSYGFDCECAEDEFIRKMETWEEIEQLQRENKRLKQWDKNKDTRNSRQRIANSKLIKENTELKAKLSSIEEILKSEIETHSLNSGVRTVLEDILEALKGNNNENT